MPVTSAFAALLGEGEKHAPRPCSATAGCGHVVGGHIPDPAALARQPSTQLPSTKAGPGSPPTPPGSSALAPLSRSQSVEPSAAGSTAGSSSSSQGADAAQPEAPAAAALRRTHCFALGVLRSPLVAAALLRLEATRSHPVHEGSGAAGLQCTLAQMLALHLRAQCDTASEPELLALLWVLEAWGDATRARCSDVLYSYLLHLDTFDLQRARGMAQDWENEFRRLRSAMVQCQAQLLAKLKWQIRLDLGAEVAPCRHLLFSTLLSPLPKATPLQTAGLSLQAAAAAGPAAAAADGQASAGQPPPAGQAAQLPATPAPAAAAAGPAAAGELPWATVMRRACEVVRIKAATLVAAASAPPPSAPTGATSGAAVTVAMGAIAVEGDVPQAAPGGDNSSHAAPPAKRQRLE